MSVINQMLRDLEARQSGDGPGSRLFRGLSSPTAHGSGNGRWLVGLSALVLLLLALVLYLLWERAAALEPVPTMAVPAEPPAAPKAVARDTSARPAPVAETALPPPAPASPAIENLPRTMLEPPAEGAAAAPAPAAESEPRMRSAPVGASAPIPPKAPPAEPTPKPQAAPVRAPLAAPEARGRSQIEKRPRPLAPEQRAARAYQKAVRLLQAGKNQQATEQLRVALAADADHLGARETLAALLLRTGRLVEAGGLLTTGLQRHPHHAAFAKLFARVRAEQGDNAGAVAILEQAVNEGRHDPQFMALLAALQQGLGRYRQSADSYRLALEAAPENSIWRVGLGISQEHAGAPDSAAENFLQALRTGGLPEPMRRYAERRLRALGYSVR